MLGLLAAIPGVGPVFSIGASIISALLRCTACMIAIAVGVAWIAGDIHGHRKSDASCQAANLSAQLAAKNADLANARRAAADAALRAAMIQKTADDEKQRNDAYVKELEGRPVPACNLTDDDLRGMRERRRGPR